MAAWTAAARQAMNVGRLSSPKSASLVHRRGMAGSSDPHGTPKVNIWQDPLSPSKWKEEHFVIASLTGWTLLFYGGYKFFTGGKKEEDCVVSNYVVNSNRYRRYRGAGRPKPVKRDAALQGGALGESG